MSKLLNIGGSLYLKKEDDGTVYMFDDYLGVAQKVEDRPIEIKVPISFGEPHPRKDGTYVDQVIDFIGEDKEDFKVVFYSQALDACKKFKENNIEVKNSIFRRLFR